MGTKAGTAALLVMLICIVAGLAFGSASSCLACSCVGLSVQQAKEQADAVFIGKAVQSKPVLGVEERGWTMGRSTHVLLEVERTYKGSAVTQFIVDAGYGEASCGFDFKVGETYLVYARQGAGGEWSTTLCSRTKELVDAVEDLPRLGLGEEPTKRVDLEGKLAMSWWGAAGVYVIMLTGRLVKPQNMWIAAGAAAVLAVAATAAYVLRRSRGLPLASSLIGSAAATVSIGLWLVLVFDNPYRPVDGGGTVVVTALLMLLPACLALLASIRQMPKAMLAALLWSLPLGLYLAGTPGIFRWYGVCNLVYAASLVFMLAGNRRP
jgi:hypothetical protein